MDPTARGLGLGRRLIDLLEQHAADHGITRLLLDTNSALVEAIALYRATGWVEVEAFNDEPHADQWFAKTSVVPSEPACAVAVTASHRATTGT